VSAKRVYNLPQPPIFVNTSRYAIEKSANPCKYPPRVLQFYI